MHTIRQPKLSQDTVARRETREIEFFVRALPDFELLVLPSVSRERRELHVVPYSHTINLWRKGGSIKPRLPYKHT